MATQLQQAEVGNGGGFLSVQIRRLSLIVTIDPVCDRAPLRLGGESLGANLLRP